MPNSKKPHIVIIGAGATGLTAAWRLLQQGVDVTVVEQSQKLGGLAGSLQVGGTPLELFYHHIFETDKAVIDLIHELGLSDKLRFYPANNGIYFDGQIYDFSTPRSMLSFPPLGLLDRLRFAASSAYLKATNNWRPLEKQFALDWMRRWAGKRVTEVIWEPLIVGKFGDRAKDISMAWLWARIHNRTFKLGYMDGGFQQIYDVLADKVQAAGGALMLGKGVSKISSTKKGVEIVCDDKKMLKADTVLATVAEPFFRTMAGLSTKKSGHEHLGATCFTLELDHQLIPNYWLNINDPSFPFLAVVEHTQMIDKDAYGGKTVVYVGNYVPRDDWRYTSEPEELLKKYIPYLKKLNPDFKKSWIKEWHFAKAPFTQPIVTRDFAKHIPAHQTELPHVFMANMAQIYPEDRGQNYAIAAANILAPTLLRDAMRGKKSTRS
ncbi:MAG TPA: NAD(P)/FAD-dependent oxidoreductase [Magnetospirillaceae bacterium]|nr:NAD(P)/FAD-dependent oxidoreductase [Magnetospirillaceae bacterium]